MRSPFPGMDPYLEQHWRDVHHRLVIYACDALQGRLPGDLRARVEERVFVESPTGLEPRRSIYPDVRVIERSPAERTEPMSDAGGVALAEPLMLHVADEPVTQGYIEIIEVGSGHRVITVIEFLSPANKAPGDGRQLYLQKQKECLEGGVSLVEIDLVRAGAWVLSVPVERIPSAYRSTYHVCVRRGWRTDLAEIDRVPLREPLPTIRIPLRPDDDDVPLELQNLIDMCYANGRYDDLDYTGEPNPPLDAADAAWADALLHGQRLR